MHDADRGGRVTCHEPGQLVGYPVMRTDDVTEFVRRIERSVIASLAEAGVESATREGLTGVWCEDRKIGSIGIHVQRGVTTHGFVDQLRQRPLDLRRGRPLRTARRADDIGRA